MKPQPTRFIILSAARTGSTLLRDMLRSHPGVFAGGELFNPRLTSQGVIPWYEIDPAHERAKINSDEILKKLRKTDPGQFIEELITITQEWGYSAIGFKWHYWFPNPEEPAAQYLIKDKRFSVIHVKRRNLLRRMVSYERALATDSWSQIPGGSPPQLPSVWLQMEKFVADVVEIELAERQYDQCFKDHPMLEVFYEDLARDPQAVAARTLDFLGIKASHQLDVTLEKTGLDPLPTAIENYDELKSSLLRWASFFED